MSDFWSEHERFNKNVMRLIVAIIIVTVIGSIAVTTVFVSIGSHFLAKVW